MIKYLLFLCASLSIFWAPVLAQQDAFPSAERSTSEIHFPNVPSIQAMWDIEFQYNLTAATGGSGNAGVVVLPSEIWVSRWATDTLSRLDYSGTLIDQFVIPGVSGTRGMTYDGTNVYIGNATTTITIVDPSTRTSTGTITSAGQVARFITYSPDADGGNGGFYIGNFNTSIDEISMTGALISSIPTGTHGLSGMYGAAYDATSTGGPYLWVYNQGSAASQNVITLLNMPSGTPAGVNHDVDPDVGVTGGLAGGLYITDLLFSGKRTIVGVSQTNPNNVLIAYDLDYVPAVDNATLVSVTGLQYTSTPVNHVQDVTPVATAQNFGTNVIANANINIDVTAAGYNSTQAFTSVPSAASFQHTGSILSTPMMGSYLLDASVDLGSVTDSDPTDNSQSIPFQVSADLYARDDDMPTGSYLASNSDWAYVATLYDIVVADTAKAVIVRLENPVDGDTLQAVIYSAPGGNPSNTQLAAGPIVETVSTQETYTLPLPNVPLTPGTYAVGTYQTAAGTRIASSGTIYNPGINFFNVAGSGWTASGIQTTRFIRLQVSNPLVSSSQAELEASIDISPNPSDGIIQLSIELTNQENLQVDVFDLTGSRVYSTRFDNIQEVNTTLDLTTLPSGLYNVVVRSNTALASRRIIKQ